MALPSLPPFIDSSGAPRATDRSVVAVEVAEVVARAETDQTVAAAVLGSAGFPDEADRVAVAVEAGFAAARAGVGQAADRDCLIVGVSPVPRPADAEFHLAAGAHFAPVGAGVGRFAVPVVAVPGYVEIDNFLESRENQLQAIDRRPKQRSPPMNRTLSSTMLLAIVTRNRQILVTLFVAIRKMDAIFGC